MSEPVHHYLVPARTASAELVIKKSRFLCTIARVENRDEAVDQVKRARREHHDARHHCSAYVMGADQSVQHSSDDGEPAGTAGAPMLEALVASGLSDVAAVVTRWFGGVLLGSGGLVRAYGDTVRAALVDTERRERRQLEEHLLVLDHTEAGRAESELRLLGVSVLNVEYADQVRLLIGVRPGRAAALLARLSELRGSAVTAELIGTRWVDGS